jgi:hypothetical protein
MADKLEHGKTYLIIAEIEALGKVQKVKIYAEYNGTLKSFKYGYNYIAASKCELSKETHPCPSQEGKEPEALEFNF